MYSKLKLATHTPQYHIVFDDKFVSVVSLDKSCADVEAIFETLDNAGLHDIYSPTPVPDGVPDRDSDGIVNGVG